MEESNKSLRMKFRQWWRILTNPTNEIDTAAATARIRDGIYFRGTNIWILACSIIIASVGLNINSVAVIIGAMLISPLMGPIIGMGLSLGINDSKLLQGAFHNFLVMVGVSLLVATLYFLITPLEFANPTELEARTAPTIFDVFIAFFGGTAGMIENSRKERGTVLSGVAIATALMPPLCTAGYGLAHGSWHFFGGAMFLFIINTTFILLATFITAETLKFGKAINSTPQSRSFRTVSSVIVSIILGVSVFSGIMMIRSNRTQKDIQSFIEENKTMGSAYIYDYKIIGNKDKTAEIFFAGEMSEDDLATLKASARRFRLDPDKLDIRSNAFGRNTDKILNNIYERADAEMAAKDMRIKELEDELTAVRGKDIPYVQLTRELKYKYPAVTSLSISRGMTISADSLSQAACTNAMISADGNLSTEDLSEIQDWLRLRLSDSTIVVRKGNTADL